MIELSSAARAQETDVDQAVESVIMSRRMSPGYRLYRKALTAYQALPSSSLSLYHLGLESVVRALVVLGTKRLRIRFPSRSTGGWWWTWRWRWEIIKQWYEYETVQWCKQLIRPGMVVLDIGAHIGYYTWLFSDLVGRLGKVIAFEPCPENYALLVSNIQARECHVALPVCAAVSDFVGEAELFLSRGHTTHSLVSGFHDKEGIVTVPTTTVDTYLAAAGNPRVGLTKIDVEGGEPQVLAGMVETIQSNPEMVIIVELNPRALQAGGHTARALVAQLEDYGFEVNEIQEGGQLVPPLGNPSNNTRNLLCLSRRAARSICNV
jgi:FkbM family methyltransferase